MKANKFIKKEIELDIIGATLLSVDEVKLIPEKLKAIGDWWWLRSPGYYTFFAAYMNYDGYVYTRGENVNFDFAGVRPALQITNLKSHNIRIGDKLDIKGVSFTVISDTLALADKIIGKSAFRKDWEKQDANDYEASDVKKFIDKWFVELKK